MCPLKSALALPLGLFLEPVDCHNVLMLATFWATGVTAFLLVYDWVGRARWAALGALVFAVSPYHGTHALGHMNLASLEFLPLYFLCLGRVLGGVPAFLGARGERARRGWAIGAGASAGLCALVDFQYPIFMALFTPVLCLGLRRGGAARVPVAELTRSLGWAGAAALLTAGPVLALVARQILEHGLPTPGAGIDLYSLDLLAPVLPSPFNALTSPLLAPLLERQPEWYESLERIGYAGIVALLLGIAALRTAPLTRPWRWVLAAGFLLSLGPSLRVLGHDTGVPLPSGLFRSVPGLDQFRAPGRFQVMTQLALALLAAEGASRLCARFGGRANALWAVGLATLVALDGAAVPALLAPARVPGAIRYLATRADESALLVAAREEPPHVWMYWQTLCEKRLLFGQLTRHHAEFERAAEEVSERLTRALKPDSGGSFRAADEVRALFRTEGVGYLIVPLRLVASTGRARKHEEMVRHFFPEGPAYADEEHAVYAFGP
jgi:hypothetical protein